MFVLRNACRFSAVTLLRGACVLQLTTNLELLTVYVGGLTATYLLNFRSWTEMNDVRMVYMELRRVKSPLSIQNWSSRTLSLFPIFQFALDSYISTTHLRLPRFSTRSGTKPLGNRIGQCKFQAKYKKQNKTQTNKEYIGKELMKEKRKWMKSGGEKMTEGKIERKTLTNEQIQRGVWKQIKSARNRLIDITALIGDVCNDVIHEYSPH